MRPNHTFRIPLQALVCTTKQTIENRSLSSLLGRVVFSTLSAFCLLLFCAASAIAQSTSTPSRHILAENDEFAIELSKDIFCGKDASIRIVSKKPGAITKINYTLTEDFGNRERKRSASSKFDALLDDNYTIYQELIAQTILLISKACPSVSQLPHPHQSECILLMKHKHA